MAGKTPSQAQFGIHPGVQMSQTIISAMPEKTGHSLEEWLEIVQEQAPAGEKERRDWLKSKHGLGLNYASIIAEAAEGKGQIFTVEGYLREAPKYVEDLFSGPKAALRPLYEALLAAGLKLGKDVKACPCKTFVPLYRKHVFAQIKPTTRTRIDLGLALKDLKTPQRLIDTGGFAKKDRITRRIEITSPDQIDDDVRRWLKT